MNPNNVALALRKKWDAIESVRCVDGKWEFGILNTLGGIHWISQKALPRRAEKAFCDMTGVEPIIFEPIKYDD
jgi:hypothetical protein